MSEEEDECCWLCLGEGKPVGAPLRQRCGCPRKSHAECLALWQLHSAGRWEETHCSFCQRQLQDWRLAFLDLPLALPVMTVLHGSRTFGIRVWPGKEGLRKFCDDVRAVCSLKAADHISLTFGCKAPRTGMKIVLRGWRTFDAAVFCAAVAAGRRYALPSASAPQQPLPALPPAEPDAVPCLCAGNSTDEHQGEDGSMDGSSSSSTASVRQTAAVSARPAATVAVSAAQAKARLVADQ